MFNLLQSQNTLKQVKVTFTLPSNKKYNGNHREESVSVVPPDAVFSIKDSQGNKIKTGKGNTTLNTRDDLKMGLDSGANASYSIHPLGDENYTYVMDNQHFITGNLSIEPSELTLSSSGATSFVYNGSNQTVGHTLTGVYAEDTGYQVSTTSGTNAGNYTATLSETSGNYILGTPSSFSWAITKAVLTLTTGNSSMTYGSSVPTQSFGYSLSGFLGGDTASVITGSASHSTTATSSSNVGSYPITTTGLSATNYTFSAVNGTLTIGPATLTATITSGSATYNGASQSVTVISGINGTYSGSASVSQRDAGSYTTTITGTGNYTGNVIGTLTIGAAPASSSGAYGTTIYSGYDGSHQSRVVVFNVSGLTYTGDTIVSLKKNVGTYPTSVTLTGNYTGTLTGYLVITEAAGFISLFSGDYIQNGNTNTVLFSRYLQSAVSTYVFTSSVSGPGAGDAYVQEGYGVQSTSYATAGFTVTLTATITDPNYTRGSSTTTITFLGYTPPPSGDGGTTTYY